MIVPMAYAEKTSVSVEKSIRELDKMLTDAGAKQRGHETDEEAGYARLHFRLDNLAVRIHLPLPKFESFARRPSSMTRGTWTVQRQRDAYEQACRTRWRALVLLVKGKLEAISIKASTVEREFLPDVVLANGITVHEALERNVAASTLLLGPSTNTDG